MKLASYNIQYGFGLDGRYDLERSLQASPMPISLVWEVTRGSPCNGHVMVAAIEALLPDHFSPMGPPVFHQIPRPRRAAGQPALPVRQYGVVALAQLCHRHAALPRSRTLSKLNMQRGATEAVIDTPKGALRAIPCISIVRPTSGSLDQPYQRSSQ